MENRKVPKLRFKEFADEWEEKRLGEIGDLTSSKRIFLSDYVNNGIPFYRGKEISELKNGKEIEDILYISKEKYEEISKKYGVPKKNDILITAVGTLGNIYLVLNEEKFYFKDGNLIWLKNISINSSYLFYSLEYNKKQILDSSIGSTQKALTIVNLNKILLNIPTLQEQQKIADFLSCVDTKISLTEEKLENLKIYKKGIMQKIFSQEIRFKDKNGNDYPEWEEKKLGEIVDINKGKQLNKEFLSKEEKYPVINGGVLPSGYTNTYNFLANTITISEGGNSCGYVNFIKNNFWAGGHCYTVEKKEDINYKYLYHILKNNETNIMELRVGSGLPNIQKKAINNYKLIISISEEEQQKIADFLSSIDNKIEKTEKKLNELKEFKKGLLQKMFV